ncbi:Nicotinamidase-related amidase [Noviherbaspirillum humi]|uniref:Nicotinamidase-related amidase n=1 Tax=Noviherbaspirillum humi TaxID=1688639 RepID=A0A239BUJ1_9BURK|nr:isochorismatase family protein [Noviherbaspirillum humi]SNS10833.1 Nicotinamidase-related amidase [Noviherbaspirillum humi]
MNPTALCDASRSALIVIDLQQRLMPAIHAGEQVIQRAHILAQAARALGVPVIGTAQTPAKLGPNVADLHALCNQVVEKDSFDACAEPAFLEALPGDRDQFIVVGCEAHVCVLQTVLGLLARRRPARLIADAVGSRDPANKAVALDRARAAGAEILTSEMVVFEWLQDSRHPRFRELMALIK